MTNPNESALVGSSEGTTTAQPKTETRARGTGSVFKRGRFWHIAFSNHGRQHAESSHSEKRSDAEKLLRHRLSEVDTRVYVARDLKFAELWEILERNYTQDNLKSLHMVELSWRLHLNPYFRGWRVHEFNGETIGKYISHRLKEGAANGTINRELSALRRACTLAVKDHKLGAVPQGFKRLKEADPRQGFLRPGTHLPLLDHAPEWFRLAIEIGRNYGWRLNEIVNLRRKQVDLLGRTIYLPPGSTKNRKARECPITDQLYPLFVAACSGKKPDDKVLSRGEKGVKSIRHQWHRTCARAGLGSFFCRKCGEPVTGQPLHCNRCGRNWQQNECRYVGLLFHDLRRTAAKNLRDSGVAEEVIMDIGGWKTASVFKRYSIVDAAAKRTAMKKLHEREQAILENAGTLLQNADNRPEMDAEAEKVVPN